MLALSVDYRMSPEHPFPAAVDDCLAAYKHLLDLGFPSSRIVTAGDSCGGGLSTIIPLATIQNHLPVPAAAISISPWYDATLSGKSMTTNSAKDVLNTTEFVNKLADRYTSGKQALRKEPLISPLFAAAADLRRLPPHWISCGGDDMLLDDGTRFAEVLQAEGVDVRLVVHQGQQHVMEFMAGRAPEADQSLHDIGEWVQRIVAEGSNKK
jgi:acetyl esterase/lipase